VGTATGSQAGGSAMQTAPAGPTVARMIAGSTLRRLRKAQGMSCEQAGRAIRVPGSVISQMELGHLPLRLRDVVDLCMLYEVADQAERTTLLGLAWESAGAEWWHRFRDAVPAWFERYLALEQAASVIRSYEVQFIPGLLQTPSYARAIITLGNRDAAARQIDQRVELRIGRQNILHRPSPPNLWMVIDEAALRRPIGGRATMREQLRHLIAACDMPWVTVAVLPFRLGWHPAAGGPVTLLRLPHQQLPDVICLEQLTFAVYYDQPRESDYYLHALNQLAIQAESAGPAQAILAEILRET
jgi:hypothetical protein